MNTENLQTLKIHRLTQTQYDRELAAGRIDENAWYLTPDETADLSGYATIEQLNEKADTSHTHEIDDIDNLQTSLDELLEASKSYTDNAISASAGANHTHAISDVENLQTILDTKVSTSITINEKPLSSNIVLSATDVGADVSGSANTALEAAKSYADGLANDKADKSHIHNDIYYKTEIDAKVSDINTSISQITNGTIIVAEATHASTADNATSAESATKAIQDGGNNVITSTYETKSDASAKLAEAKTYADGIKNDLLNGAGGAYDTLKELGDLIDDNTNAIDALEIVANGKADANHNHDSLYDTKGSADAAVDTHNASTSAHSDIRSSIGSLQTEVSNNLTTLTNHTDNKSNPHGVTLSQLGVNATADELNTLDGITATATELNYISGVTSDVQTQIDGKADTSHTHDEYMEKANPVGTGSFSMNRMADTEIGNYSSTFGDRCIASGKSSHAEGVVTQATGGFSHAEGCATTASGGYSHAEGSGSTASEAYSHAEGCATTASGTASHSEGCRTTASGYSSHATGYETEASGHSCHAEGYKTVASGGDILIGEFEEYQSHASHAEGYETIANGIAAHAEGYNTTASGETSHAEGCWTIASGNHSHAEGSQTEASGAYSHAEGCWTIASGYVSHAEGYQTTALDYQHAQGHYNNTTSAKAGVDSGTGDGTAFVIGNGTETTASNAFRVTYAGKPYAKSTLTTTGADYAEFFEWQDLNTDNEDRRGYFVTMDEDKIKIAEPNDYILGIISGQPSVVGGGDEDWLGRYVFDEFGAFVYEDFEYEVDEFDKETGKKITVTKTGKRYKENPDYDPTIPYIQREDRPEWDYVGMLGVLSVRDDGTCEVNGCCTVAEGGIATASETGYRVIKRVSDNIVKVIFR